MKPMHKGVGLIALATGATVLAINLLGGAKEETTGSSDVAAQPSQQLRTEASAKVLLASADLDAEIRAKDAAVSSEVEAAGLVLTSADVAKKVAATEVESSAGQIKVAAGMEKPAAVLEKSVAIETPAGSGQSAADVAAVPTEGEVGSEASVSSGAESATMQAPPPGLFRESDQETAGASAMVAPEAPVSPEKPAEMSPGQAPAQPEAVKVEMHAPEAPKGIAAELLVAPPAAPAAPVAVETSGFAPVAPASTKQTAVTAGQVEGLAPTITSAQDEENEQGVLSITPPPPMPDLEKIGKQAGAPEAGPAQAALPSKGVAATPASLMPVAPKGPEPVPGPKAPLAGDAGIAMPKKAQSKHGAMYGGKPYMQSPGPKMPQGMGRMMLPDPKMVPGQGSWGKVRGGNSGASMPPAGYMPRVYYVPVPLMPYGQPMMPYAGGGYGGYPMYPAPMPVKPLAPPKEAKPAPQDK